jgi:serine/threonine protein phosphatase 1
VATYVLSDVHGHLAPLLRALDDVSPAEEDHIFVLGDMVDRGPDPVGVLKACRALPNCVVLMGNHERMMLDCLAGADEDIAWVNWAINGGGMTAHGLADLPEDEIVDLVGWVAGLPLRARTRVGGRDYLLVHAGIRPGTYEVPETWDDAALDAVLTSQGDEDLLWIRNEFWGAPTGLVDEEGHGPIVVAGHTPTVVVEAHADVCDRSAVADGASRMLRLGATERTGGVPDRFAIDCGAGSVPSSGRVLILRLDDGQEFYQPIGEDE